jgi:hypothetical protein
MVEAHEANFAIVFGEKKALKLLKCRLTHNGG